MNESCGHAPNGHFGVRPLLDAGNQWQLALGGRCEFGTAVDANDELEFGEMLKIGANSDVRNAEMTRQLLDHHMPVLVKQLQDFTPSLLARLLVLVHAVLVTSLFSLYEKPTVTS